MTTYTFKNITLEHDREWRAWVTLSHGTLQRGDAVYVRGTWYGTNESAVGEPMLLGSLYRRPVPLPLLDPDLTDTLWVHGWSATEDSVERVYVHPTTGEETHSHDTARDWLRALLPGYEEQLAREDSPVPADGWRPWHHSVKYVTRVKKMPVDRWVDRDEFDTEEEARADLAFVAPLLPSLKCHIIRREVTEHVLEPLPPPPQEKGGEA